MIYTRCWHHRFNVCQQGDVKVPFFNTIKKPLQLSSGFSKNKKLKKNYGLMFVAETNANNAVTVALSNSGAGNTSVAVNVRL
jgi:hypothetical protein